MSKQPFNKYILAICLISFCHILSKTTEQDIVLTEFITNNYTNSTFGPEKITPLDDTKPNGFSEAFEKEIAARVLTLSDHEVQKAAFNLACNKREFNSGISDSDIIDSSFIDKLEIIGGGENKTLHLVKSIVQDQTNTAIGNAFTALTLCHPTTDIEVLRCRQQIISHLSTHDQLREALNSALMTIGRSEKKSLVFWQNKPLVNEKNLATMRFDIFDRFFGLNTKPLALELWNKELFVLSQALTVAAMPYGYTWTKKNLPSLLNVAIMEIALTVGFAAFTSYYLTAPLIKHQITACNHLHSILITTANHIASLRKISVALQQHKLLVDNCPSLKPLAEFTNSAKHSAKLNKLLNILNTKTFTGEPSVFNSYTGRVLAAYELMQEVKSELAPVFAAAGELDMYVGLAKLYNSRESKDARYCIVNFIKDNATPIIDAEDFWNPFINADTVVVNNAHFDTSCPNSILTGPNTGGKSTVIKGIMINILMAQTFGIAPSKNFSLTPFVRLNCFMNISDDVGVGASLFQSEVLRAKKILIMLQSLNPNEFSFVIIDEVFSSASPVEGEKAAIQFAKRLGSYKNNISIIATHYPQMVELEKETNGAFCNRHVEILRNEDGSLNRTFKLKTGPSFMSVVSDILEEQGLFI